MSIEQVPVQKDSQGGNLPPLFLRFDRLPNDAIVPLEVVLLLYNIHLATLWRRIKRGDIPAPDKRLRGWRVGGLRANLRGEDRKAA